VADNSKLLETKEVRELYYMLWEALGVISGIGCGEVNVQSKELKQRVVEMLEFMGTFVAENSMQRKFVEMMLDLAKKVVE
jgi:hypothetical protein